MPAKKPKPDEKPQSERFIETAREIGVDETKEGFEKVFSVIVNSPQPEPRRGKKGTPE
jgi:hypothetical protein